MGQTACTSLEVPQTQGGEEAGLEGPRPISELSAPIGESEWAGLISGTPKSWSPNSGCGGLGSEGQQEVIQRPTVRPHAPGQTEGPSSKVLERVAHPELGGISITGSRSAQDSGPHSIN